MTRAIPAIKVHQWLPEWNAVQFDSEAKQAKPQSYFFICSIKARHLKALTGVYRRSTKQGIPRAKDPNVQRGHQEERSEVIREFVKFGFPWCEMRESLREQPQAGDLRKPGWLPTAILVNVLTEGSKRNGVEIPDSDLVRIEELNGSAILNLPKNFRGTDWEPSKVFPMEVIDGQHRLWAFDEFDPGDDFELPVVAFHGLDISWQAYLFWSVNITPKRINRSLAFDLYPLLRREDWLDKFAGHSIYRETRCQELVETLWSHSESPWYQRINMLGETKRERESSVPMVTQAAWIRSLMVTFVKQWEGTGTKIGGLFGASGSVDDLILPWNRPMQAAFLIHSGKQLKEQVARSKAKWARHLRQHTQEELFAKDDLAFYGDYSLLSTDQGIRGFLFALNDVCFVQADKLGLRDWTWEEVYSGSKAKSMAATEEAAVTSAMKSLFRTNVAKTIEELTTRLSDYDWRTSSTPGLTADERQHQSIFRGSSGYKELRRELLLHLSQAKGLVGEGAHKAIEVLGYR